MLYYDATEIVTKIQKHNIVLLNFFMAFEHVKLVHMRLAVTARKCAGWEL